ncbi:MAG: HAD family hydrolase [Dehalococcoidia bacterium]
MTTAETTQQVGPADGRAPLDLSVIKAVAFDAYGTLFHWDFILTVQEVLAQQGLGGDHEDVAKTFQDEAFRKVSVWAEHTGEDGKLDRKRLADGPPPPWIATWETWRRQFEYTFQKFELAGDPVAGANHLRHVLSHAPAYPDAFESIERLAGRYLVGLMSNADEDFLQSAVSVNRLRFSVIQSSESLRIYKPNRAAFLALAQRFSCEAREVLYVGDTPGADVAGAVNAGMRAAYLRRNDAEYPKDTALPDIETRSLAELTAILAP